MAIELIIQIDLDREDEDRQIACRIKKHNSNLGEVNNLIAELERAKQFLLEMTFEDDGEETNY